jgi:hypothetical protein
VVVEPTPDAVRLGREALARAAWEEARRAFEAALVHEETAEALEGLGAAAWWLDDAPVTFDARERAYRLYVERGERCAAARVATAIAWDYEAFRGELAVAGGWLAQARRQLAGLEVTPEHGWLVLREGEIANVRSTAGAVRAFSPGGAYLNFFDADEGEARIRAAYGDAKYERLVALKNQYDPENVFRLNQNIRPTGR